MTPNEAAEKVQSKKAVLVDVRELDEVQDGMAEPAQWFSLYEMEDGNPKFQDFLKKLDPSKEIILYCKSGGRSGKAAELLSEKKFKTTNLGGFDTWADAGLPVRKGP